MSSIGQILQSVLKYKGAIGLAGLIVLCVLLVLLQILRLPIFVPISEAGTLTLLSLIVRSVFWLATTAVVVSGVGYVLPARLFIPISNLEYAVAVFRMIDPVQAGGIAALNDQFEPYVGFPYYSRESDHPSCWPPRVMRDREALGEQYEAFFGRAEVQAALKTARAKAGDTSSIQVLSSAPDGADPVAAVIASARMFFNFHLNGDQQALADALGAPLASEFLAIEAARNRYRAYLPNRIAVLRLHNAGSRTVRDVTIEYEVAGPVYDTKVRAVSEGASEQFLPFEHRLVIPSILPGQTYDVTVWYQYQSVDERAFPDKTNFIQELTQGFTISNIAAATGARVVFRPNLLAQVPAYERLYDGDGRRRDDPERELAALFAERAKATEAAMKVYDEEHLTVRDLTLDALTDFAVEETQIDNVWVGFHSPAGRQYCAVCVYTHPKGPYVLLSSEDRDETDFRIVRTALAEALHGEPEEEITHRSDDICSTVAMPAGFTRQAIRVAFSRMTANGFGGISVQRLNYHKTV